MRHYNCFLLITLLTNCNPVLAEEKSVSGISDLIKKEIAYEESGNYSEALEACDSILRLDPNHVETLNTKAGIYGGLQDYKAEIAWAEKAIDVNKNYVPAYLNRGNAFYKLGNIPAAAANFEYARRLEPQNALPYYSLGVLAEEMHDLEDAIDYYEKSVKANPKFESGLYNLAAMYANSGRFEDSRALIKRILTINPDAHDARAMLAKIEEELKRH